MDKVDVVVVGAGVVGLACARMFAQRGHETLILEQASRFGQGISSRSSEIIHSGIYYPRNSHKARLCVRGRDALYEYCRRKDIPYRRTGKLIVATHKTQWPELEQLHQRAIANGVLDTVILDRHATLELEPELQCIAALYSPSAGVIDTHALMQALLADAEAAGAVLVSHARVTGGQVSGGNIRLRVFSGSETHLQSRVVINAAGLDAVALAATIQGYPAERVPPVYYAKGSYFGLSGRAPFKHLIYPIPEPGGLGIHLTLDMAGDARFGPDVEWVKVPSYQVSESRETHFRDAIARYWPGISTRRLQPAYAGVRPKIVGPGQPPADFMLQGPAEHGVPGLVNLFGIESPGLTAALAIADTAINTVESTLF